MTIEFCSLTYYYAHDHLYSVAAVFGPNGGLLQGERYEYDAYGSVSIMSGTYAARSSGTIGNPYTFTGRRLDSLDPDGSGGHQLKLMYYRARTYDPQTGRFMQRDPLGINPAGGVENLFSIHKQYSNGLNTYEYVKSNSVKNIDPQGLKGPPTPDIPIITGGPWIDVWTRWEWPDIEDSQDLRECNEEWKGSRRTVTAGAAIFTTTRTETTYYRVWKYIPFIPMLRDKVVWHYGTGPLIEYTCENFNNGVEWVGRRLGTISEEMLFKKVRTRQKNKCTYRYFQGDIHNPGSEWPPPVDRKI